VRIGASIEDKRLFGIHLFFFAQLLQLENRLKLSAFIAIGWKNEVG
jgi:hypothetical protein